MFRGLASSLLLACAATLSGCSGGSGFDEATGASSAATSASASGPAITSLFLTPSAGGEQRVIEAINGAETSVRMIMFHLTNPAVVEALVAAAGRGVSVEMIL